MWYPFHIAMQNRVCINFLDNYLAESYTFGKRMFVLLCITNFDDGW